MPTLAKKHFKAIVRAMQVSRPMLIAPTTPARERRYEYVHAYWSDIVISIGDALEKLEPKFNKEKFINACYS
jgi:hypothetical protein